MKKIASKEEKEHKKRRNQLMIGIILIAVMLLSVMGYSFQSQSGTDSSGNKKISYNGFDFSSQNGFWVTKIGSAQFYFKYNPNEVGKLDYTPSQNYSSYQGKAVYIYSEDSEANLELYRNLQPIAERIQSACLKGENCENDTDWPVKTCDDNLIVVKESSIKEIKEDKNCIFINAPKEDLTKTSDEFLFKILGIEQ